MADKDLEKTNLKRESVEVEKQDVPLVASIRVDIDEVVTAEQEAEKRGISVQQWQDVLHLIENAEKVDRDVYPDAPEDLALTNFEFDGNGNIIVPGDLCLDDSTVTHLPKNLKIQGALYLSGAEHLFMLPEGLEVGTYIELGYFDLIDEEKELPYLFEMILAGKIKGAVLPSWDADLINLK